MLPWQWHLSLSALTCCHSKFQSFFLSFSLFKFCGPASAAGKPSGWERKSERKRERVFHQVWNALLDSVYISKVKCHSWAVGKKNGERQWKSHPTVLTAYIFEMNCNLKCWLLFWKVHQSWYQMLPTKRALWCTGNIQLRESNLCLPCLLCKLAEPVRLIGFELRGPERSFGDIEIEAMEEEKNPILKN